MEQSAFSRLLQLLDVEATTDVPTAAVTLGDRSRLSINPDFVRRMCSSDYDLVMLVLHELHHVALGHTRLFPRVTRAQNWAFDCVINAQLCRLYPGPEWTALFRRSYRADVFPEALLRPPEGWGTDDVRWRPGREGEVHRALYTDHSVSYTDLYELLQKLAGGEPLAVDGLLGNHEERDGDAWPPDLLREVRNILAEWPMVETALGARSGRRRETRLRAARRGAAGHGSSTPPGAPLGRRGGLGSRGTRGT